MNLGRRSRTILAVAGAGLAAAAFALLPLYGDSTVGFEVRESGGDGGGNSVLHNQQDVHLARVDDPFAHPLPEDHAIASIRPSLGRPAKNPVRLRAIVAGKQHLALIDDGSSRIVTAGESVDGVRIVEIGLDDMRLSDGRVLHVDDSPL